MYYLKKFYSSLKINLLYGKIDILITGRSSSTNHSNILNECLKLRELLQQHKNDFNEDFVLFRLVNEEEIERYKKNNTLDMVLGITPLEKM